MSRRKNTWWLENHPKRNGLFSHIYDTVEKCGLYCSIARNIHNKKKVAIGGWGTTARPYILVEVCEYTIESAIVSDCRMYYNMIMDKYPHLYEELMSKSREERMSIS